MPGKRSPEVPTGSRADSSEPSVRPITSRVIAGPQGDQYCFDRVARLLKEYPSDRIVLDNSHAFHTPAPPCLATLYSPRKFFGVPDGGYLVTRLPVKSPDVQDIQSIDRIRPLLMRFSEGPEAGHQEAKRANLSLKGLPPMAMF